MVRRRRAPNGRLAVEAFWISPEHRMSPMTTFETTTTGLQTRPPDAP